MRVTWVYLALILNGVLLIGCSPDADITTANTSNPSALGVDEGEKILALKVYHKDTTCASCGYTIKVYSNGEVIRSDASEKVRMVSFNASLVKALILKLNASSGLDKSIVQSPTAALCDGKTDKVYAYVDEEAILVKDVRDCAGIFYLGLTELAGNTAPPVGARDLKQLFRDVLTISDSIAVQARIVDGSDTAIY